MSDKDSGSIYISIKPKRWRITRSYEVLYGLEQLSKIRKLGHVPFGIHDGAGLPPNFVLHILFANKEDKQNYMLSPLYEHYAKKLKRYSKRSGLVLLTD